MEYPIYKEQKNFGEFDMILSEDKLVSVRNSARTKAAGLSFENPTAVSIAMGFEDSTKERFEDNFKQVGKFIEEQRSNLRLSIHDN